MKTRLLTISFLALFIGSLHATTIAVSNLGQPTSATTYAIGKSVPAFDFQQGVSFTTGASGVDLESVTLSFFSRNGAATGFALALYTNLTAAGPSGLVTLLTGNSTPATGLETYTPAVSTALLGGTTYWLVESAVSTSANTGFSLKGTNSLAEDAGGLAGWNIGDARMVSNNGGASWFSAASTSGTLQFSVNVASVPETGATLLLLGAALAGMAALRRKFSAEFGT